MLRDADTNHTTFSQGFRSALKRLDADAANHPRPEGVTCHASGPSDGAAGPSSFSKALTAAGGQSGPSGAAKGAGIGPLVILGNPLTGFPPKMTESKTKSIEITVLYASRGSNFKDAVLRFYPAGRWALASGRSSVTRHMLA